MLADIMHALLWLVCGVAVQLHSWLWGLWSQRSVQLSTQDTLCLQWHCVPPWWVDHHSWCYPYYCGMHTAPAGEYWPFKGPQGHLWRHIGRPQPVTSQQRAF